jgi:metallo-beta-lactamase class B
MCFRYTISIPGIMVSDKQSLRKAFAIAILVFMAGSAWGQQPSSKLVISSLTKDTYVYTTWGDPGNGSLFPANGLYLVTSKGVVLFDTPWDTTQFQPLLDSIRLRHHKNVVICIATHFHADRTAGLAFYSNKGIKTYTSKLTDDLCKEKNEPRAANLLYRDTSFHIGQYTFQTYYPGKGHSPDNIVIWIDQNRTLYGGCFIKSTETNNIGNLSDANVGEWVKSVKKTQAKFENPAFIIPGHQGWADKNALSHTLEILENYQRTKGL